MKKIKGLPDWFLAYSKGRYIREKNRKHMGWWDPWDRYTYGFYGLGFIVFYALYFLLVSQKEVSETMDAIIVYGFVPLIFGLIYLFDKKYKEELLDFFENEKTDIEVWSIKRVRLFEIGVYLAAFGMIAISMIFSGR